jgi:hypothetical protein
VFYTTGVTGGEAMNFKSGCLADLAYNLVYSCNTNAFKLSNAATVTRRHTLLPITTPWLTPAGEGLPQKVVRFGWKPPYVLICTTILFANTRYGIKRDPKKLEDSRSKNDYNWYYGFDQTTVNQFQVGSNDIVPGGTNDVRGTTAGQNDPKFVNYPLE